MGWVRGGAVAGTTGRALRVEGLRVRLSAGMVGDVHYRAHVASLGWMKWVKTVK